MEKMSKMIQKYPNFYCIFHNFLRFRRFLNCFGDVQRSKNPKPSGKVFGIDIHYLSFEKFLKLFNLLQNGLFLSINCIFAMCLSYQSICLLFLQSFPLFSAVIFCSFVKTLRYVVEFCAYLLVLGFFILQFFGEVKKSLRQTQRSQGTVK